MQLNAGEGAEGNPQPQSSNSTNSSNDAKVETNQPKIAKGLSTLKDSRIILYVFVFMLDRQPEY